MIYLYLGVIILTVLSMFKKEKNGIWISILFCGILAFIFAFTTDISDQSSYFEFYETVSFDNVQFINYDNSSILFTYINIIFKELGFTFNTFRLLVFIVIAGTLMALYNKKIESGIFLMVYATVPFFLDLVQIRFFCAASLFFVAIYFLITGRKWIYCLIVLLASLIHSMLIPFIIFAFLPQNGTIEKRKVRLLVLISVGFIVAGSMSGTLISLLQTAVSSISAFDEYSGYMTVKVQRGYLLYVIYQCANLAMSMYTARKIEEMGEDGFTIPQWNQRLNKLNLNIQIIGILFIVSTMININFSRYFRIFLLINILNFSSYVGLKKEGYGVVSSEMKLEPRYKISTESAIDAAIYIAVISIWIFGETQINASFGHIFEQVFSQI